MKRIVTTLCALAVIMVGSIPAMAAEEPPRQDASYYPISVDEYTYGHRRWSQPPEAMPAAWHSL